jgi:hypothetical protein
MPLARPMPRDMGGRNGKESAHNKFASNGFSYNSTFPDVS